MTMKKMISLGLAACMALALAIPAGASAPKPNDPNLTEDNIRHVEAIFDGTASITDNNGNDVTDSFIAATYPSYSSGDYMYVLDYLIDNNLAIEWPVDPISTQVVVNGSVTTSKTTIYFKSPLTGGVTKEYITFSFTGTFQYNDYNNTITNGTNIKMNITDQSSSSLTKVAYLTDKSWTIGANNKSITFTAKYAALIYTAIGAAGDTQTGSRVFSKAF